MIYKGLGKTGFLVSRLCFGTLTIGPLQKNLPVKEGAYLLETAYGHGVNFYDTAEIYENYGYIKKAFGKNKNVIIATKSYAYDKQGAGESLEKYLKETGRERAEIFLLHEQESAHTIRGHYDALMYYVRKKEEGLIGAVGLSTHHISAVKAALNLKEIQVIHPIINYLGMGIADGSLEEMQQAVVDAHGAGKAVYAMKSLGGGNLISEREKAFSYIRGLSCLDSIAVGMHCIDEILFNTRYFSMQQPDEKIAGRLIRQKRSITIEDTCAACGKCVSICAQKAIYIKNEKAHVHKEKCVFCGYCGRECGTLSIKIF